MAASLNAATLFSCKDLVAVVTGGGTGIGLMIACALEQNGALVYILGRRFDIIKTAAERNNAEKHGRIVPVQANVTDKASLQYVVDKIEAEVGFINLLVNNAGVAAPAHVGLKTPPPFPNARQELGLETTETESIAALRDSLWSETMEDWDWNLRVNVSGVWFTSVAFLGLLGKGTEKRNVVQSSQIVTISSIGGYHRLMSSGFAYHAAKAGVNLLAKSMATNFVQYSVRSNVIVPGLYPSEMSAGGHGSLDENNRSKLPSSIPEKYVPLGRFGDEQDMAAAILSLAGPGGKYYNGNCVLTDGGRLGILPSTY